MKIELTGLIIIIITYLIGGYVLDSTFHTPWINFIPFHVIGATGVSIFALLLSDACRRDK